MYDPAGEVAQNSQAVNPEVGKVTLVLGNNGEIAKGLGGSTKGFRYFDSGLEKAGAFRILCHAAEKISVADIKEDERLKVAFDVRFDGKFDRTLFEFRVQGQDGDGANITLTNLYVIPNGILNATNSTERSNAYLSFPQPLFEKTQDRSMGKEYHFELYFDIKNSTYDVVVYSEEDRENPYIYEIGLDFTKKRNRDAQTELEYFDQGILNIGSQNFGAEGAIVIDNILVEVVDAPKEDGTTGIDGKKVQAIRVFGEGERKNMVRDYHTKMGEGRPIPEVTQAEWESLRAELKKKIMYGLGLDPLPPAAPLDLTYGKSLDRPDCTITRVQYQTFPGLYATAFLYMPKDLKTPAPAVFHPHGHWANWSADDIVQSRCIALARKGYVSLAVQYEHYQDLPTGVTKRGVFLYNNMRGLDVLASLPEVDKTRMGVTGASGGGMQTADLAALDDRIKAVTEVVFNTYYHRDFSFALPDEADACWSAPLGALQYMDQNWLLAMIAPRPTAVLSVTGDWTAKAIDEELPQVVRIFNLFHEKEGQKEGPKVENIFGDQPHRILTSQDGRFFAERFQGTHDYTKAMRERMVWWMDWWLKGERKPAPEPEGDLALENPKTLQSLVVDPPKGHPWSDAALAEVMRPGRIFQPPHLTNKKEWEAYTNDLRVKLNALLGVPKKASDWKQESKQVSLTTFKNWAIEKLWYTSEEGVKIPALWIRPSHEATPSKKVTILLSGNGKNDLLQEPMYSICQKILDQGRSVLAIDPRMRGEWSERMALPGTISSNTSTIPARLWGRPEVGAASDDILAAIDYLESQKAAGDIEVAGYGQMVGYAALLAAARDHRIIRCVADCNHEDFGTTSVQVPGLLPNILRVGNVGEIAALVAPRSLDLVNVSPQTSLETAQAAYQLLGAEEHLQTGQKIEGLVTSISKE